MITLLTVEEIHTAYYAIDDKDPDKDRIIESITSKIQHEEIPVGSKRIYTELVKKERMTRDELFGIIEIERFPAI